MIREDFFRMIWVTYGIEPDYPFAGDFETAVFRRKDNLKWFAISMSVASEKIGIGCFRRFGHRQSQMHGRRSGTFSRIGKRSPRLPYEQKAVAHGDFG